MTISKRVVLAIALLATSTIPALAGVVVSSPGNYSTVGSPFPLSAYASTCAAQNVVSMGYSLDNGTNTTIVYNTSVSASIPAAAGGHTLHVKAWGNSGAVCVTDVSITVSTAGLIPPYAASVGGIQSLSNWSAVHDPGTPGSSTGSMGVTSSPSRSGAARRFTTSYSYYGGERYTVIFGDDQSAQNFVFDTWVYIAGSSAGIANLEIDLSQVMPNGQTVIFGFQCDGWSGTWDYTANKGTPTNYSDQWVQSSAPCNVRSWSTNTWHHVQIAYSRNSSGYITYNTVSLDGVQQSINATVLGAFQLGWGPVLLANVQVDGATSGSGSSTVYVDDMTLYRW